MSATEDARQGELDAALDNASPGPALAGELFAVADLLDTQPVLRRALTDPGARVEQRQELVGRLLGAQISDGALSVVKAAVALRWGGASGLAAALDRQGARAEFLAAAQSGNLDAVEGEIFRFARVVAADRELAAVLGNRSAPLGLRQQVVSDLLQNRAQPGTVAIVRRAVTARRRTFDLSVEEYLEIAASVQRRSIARVVVARPLTNQQTERLAAALSRQLGRDITLQVQVDPTVLGGVQVSVGDEVIEGTVAGKLNQAERSIR